MEEINGGNVAEHQRWNGFVQELHIARDQELLTFKVRPDPTPNVAEVNPHWYLQTISDFALTVEGQDRARGRMVVQPLPNPDEDDGRKISNLTFRQIASAITDRYEPSDIADFLSEEGLLPSELPLADGEARHDAYRILTSLWRWGSEGRRLTRRFIGGWLNDQLLSGPDAELRASLIEQLARQGWRISEANSALAIDEPISGVPLDAPFLRASRLHPLVEIEARPQFLIGKPEQGVFAAMRAVEIRVRKLAGLGTDNFGVGLMNKAFGATGQLCRPEKSRGPSRGGLRRHLGGSRGRANCELADAAPRSHRSAARTQFGLMAQSDGPARPEMRSAVPSPRTGFPGRRPDV